MKNADLDDKSLTFRVKTISERWLRPQEPAGDGVAFSTIVTTVYRITGVYTEALLAFR